MPPLALQGHDALLVVDVQNDFLPAGSLPVRGGDAVVPVLNGYLSQFRRHGLPIIATRDWHPPDHCSFAARGGPWPVHCVAGTPGADFPPELELPGGSLVISKAITPDRDAYSGFEGTRLNDELRDLGRRRLFIGGLATDYCVLNTVKDALRNGYEAFLLADAVRAVEVQAGDGDRAIAEMIGLGARRLTLGELQ